MKMYKGKAKNREIIKLINAKTIVEIFFIVVLTVCAFCIVLSLTSQNANAAYTSKEFFNKFNERISPKLGDPQPPRILLKNPEHRTNYTLFTSYDWPGLVCKTKFYYNNNLRKTQCINTEVNKNERRGSN